MTDAVLNPTRLRLARELKSWSQADLSAAAEVTPAAVSQYEGGTQRPAGATLARLADKLDVPLAYLTAPLTEVHEGFFRSLRRSSMTQRRRARALAHVAHDLGVEAGHHSTSSLPTYPVDLDAPREEIEAIAGRVRHDLGIPAGPVQDVVNLLEAHGALVMRLPLDSEDVDAFSLPFPDLPVVVLASDKGDRARSRFDAAHELGHLVLHGEHVWGMKEVEQQAHWFAAAFLMPAAEIHDDLPNYPDWPRLFDLKKRWQVSLAALLMRAKTLQRMSDAQYLTAIKASSARGWRRSEPIPLGRPEEPKMLKSILATSSGRRAALSQPPAVVEAISSALAA